MLGRAEVACRKNRNAFVLADRNWCHEERDLAPCCPGVGMQTGFGASACLVAPSSFLKEGRGSLILRLLLFWGSCAVAFPVPEQSQSCSLSHALLMPCKPTAPAVTIPCPAGPLATARCEGTAPVSCSSPPSN